MNDAKPVLENALRLLSRPRGWTKGEAERFVKYDGKRIKAYCALGAIYVSSSKGSVTGAYDALVSAAKTNSIASWNDRKTQTKRNVIATFKKAIAKLS